MLNKTALLAEKERRFRAKLRSDFATFCDFALPSVAPDATAPAAHHKLLIAELQRVADTPQGKLMLFLPPGSAKSTYASVLFPAWFMKRQHSRIIGASHTMDLAELFSGRVQGLIADQSIRLGFDLNTRNKGRWQTSNGAEYRAVGVGGAIAGTRGDLAVIDDPVKSAEAADSATQREAVWQWFTRDLRSRLKPSGKIVVVMTRWHMDDLAGRILQYQADKWRVVSLPALAVEGDPLGRAPGEALWGDDSYGYGALLRTVRKEMEAEGNARAWSALYQQEPRPQEGLLFQVARIGVEPATQTSGRAVRAWDLAATIANTGDPDWTCGVRLRRDGAGRFIIEDVVRFRGGPEQVEATIRATASRDGRGVAIGLPQDPGQAGKSQVLSFTRQLAGYDVKSSPETGSKETRAAPVAAQCNVGNLLVVQAPWNAALIEELRDFPTGRKDDQVDALSRAFGMLIAANPPASSQLFRL